jgi:hypothetical protein
MRDNLPFLFGFMAVVALAQRTWPTPAGMRCPDRTLVLYEIQAAHAGNMSGLFKEHLAYSLKHLRAGNIVNLGISDIGAAAVFTSTEWPEVEAIINQDPYIREHVAVVVSHTVWHACEAER